MKDISDVKWIDAPVFIIFWTLLTIVFIQFFSRYVLNSSLIWTEEIARYLLILLGIAGSVTCIRKRSHIFLEFFYRFTPATVVNWLVIIVSFINAAFSPMPGSLVLSSPSELTTSQWPQLISLKDLFTGQSQQAALPWSGGKRRDRYT